MHFRCHIDTKMARHVGNSPRLAPRHSIWAQSYAHLPLCDAADASGIGNPILRNGRPCPADTEHPTPFFYRKILPRVFFIYLFGRCHVQKIYKSILGFFFEDFKDAQLHHTFFFVVNSSRKILEPLLASMARRKFYRGPSSGDPCPMNSGFWTTLFFFWYKMSVAHGGGTQLKY